MKTVKYYYIAESESQEQIYDVKDSIFRTYASLAEAETAYLLIPEVDEDGDRRDDLHIYENETIEYMGGE